MAKSLADAERAARSLVNKWTLVAGAIGAVPGSTLFLAGADVKIIHDVASSVEEL